MKRILRLYVFDTVSLYLASQIARGLVFENGLVTLLLAGLGLVGSTLVVKPIINILLLPINLVTFGFFKWASSAIALYIVTLVIQGFKVTRFESTAISSPWIDIPGVFLEGILAFVAFSFLIFILTSLMTWLTK
jgi:putative membrane protein